MSRLFEFTVLYSKQLIQIFCWGGFGTFVIKPPLDCGSAYLVRNTNRTVWDFFLLTLIKQSQRNPGPGKSLVPQSLTMIQSKTYSLNEVTMLKFIYSEKATKFCETSIFWLALHRTKVRWRFRKILWPSQKFNKPTIVSGSDIVIFTLEHFLVG